MLSNIANWAQIISVLPILGGIGMVYHRMLCQEPGCKRLGHPLRAHRCQKHAA